VALKEMGNYCLEPTHTIVLLIECDKVLLLTNKTRCLICIYLVIIHHVLYAFAGMLKGKHPHEQRTSIRPHDLDHTSDHRVVQEEGVERIVTSLREQQRHEHQQVHLHVLDRGLGQCLKGGPRICEHSFVSHNCFHRLVHLIERAGKVNNVEAAVDSWR